MRKMEFFILFLNNFQNNILKLNLYKKTGQDFYPNKFELKLLLL